MRDPVIIQINVSNKQIVFSPVRRVIRFAAFIIFILKSVVFPAISLALSSAISALIALSRVKLVKSPPSNNQSDLRIQPNQPISFFEK